MNEMMTHILMYIGDNNRVYFVFVLNQMFALKDEMETFVV